MNKVSNIINNKIFKRIAVLVILFAAIFGLSKSISNSNKELVVVNNRLDRRQFKIYKQKDDKSGYEVYNGSGFPEGQKLNTSLTVCVDTNNNTVENIFTYENGKFSVTSNKTVFCTLYFDIVNSLTKALALSNSLVQEYRGDGYYHDESDKDTEHPFFTRPIYYWYVPSSSYNGHTAAENAEIVRDSWNVVYAGRCWQIIRTTEQGGVKLLYNGEPDIGTDQQGNTTYDCSDNRNLYHMGEIESEYIISGSKVYGDSYTATTSGTTTTFTLVNSDSSDVQTKSITSSNASEVVGMYTCGNTSTTCTNASLKKIVRIKTGTTAIIYTSTERDNIGNNSFNSQYDSPAYVGYMYNDHPAYTSKSLAQMTSIGVYHIENVINSFSASTYPTWNSTNNSYNVLTGAQTASQIKGSDSDYSALVGKYTFNKTSSTTSTVVYYVVAVSGTTMYVRTAEYGAIPSNANTTTYTIGTSIVDNLDGTYTISNTNNYDITTWTSSPISPSTSNYYYMCADGVSTTCAYGDARFILSKEETQIGKWYLANTNNTYGTYKLGTTLTDNGNDTYTLGGTTSDILAINWYRQYSSANKKYMCISGDTTCSKANIYYNAAQDYSHYVYSRTYTPDTNYKLTNSYSYNNGTYTLDMSDSNAINTWDDFFTSNDGTPTFDTAMLNKMVKAHYVCLDNSDNPVPNTISCSNVGYIYYYYTSITTAYFMKLSNGQYINTDINNVLYQEDNNLLWRMLYASDVNTISSTIKTNIDKWYEANILNTSAESLIDNDEIYCADRSTSNSFGSWNLNANNIVTNINFYGLGYKSVVINSKNITQYNLSCPNKLDAYSKNETAKGNGDLTYAIGLISYPEMDNIGYSTTKKSQSKYWLASPKYFNNSQAYEYYASTDGNLSTATLSYVYGSRPSIALKSTVEYTRGDGSMTNPYVVE